MLKAIVTLNRKITRDYNSTGYGVSIEGEIATTPDDHEGVLGRVKELFALAEEALAIEIDRDQGESAIGRRDEQPASAPPARSNANGANGQSNKPQGNDQPNGNGQSGPDKITDKQVKYLFTLAKRNRFVFQPTRIRNRTGRRSASPGLRSHQTGGRPGDRRHDKDR